MTASPMNFSTVPPCRSSSLRTRSWYGREDGPHLLRVELLGSRGEADEVAEEDGDDLALLRRSAGRRSEGRSALLAELRAVSVVVTTGVTNSHPREPTTGVELEVFIRAMDAVRFVEELRGDDPELASYLRIEERELEAGGLN